MHARVNKFFEPETRYASLWSQMLSVLPLPSTRPHSSSQSQSPELHKPETLTFLSLASTSSLSLQLNAALSSTMLIATSGYFNLNANELK